MSSIAHSEQKKKTIDEREKKEVIKDIGPQKVKVTLHERELSPIEL